MGVRIKFNEDEYLKGLKTAEQNLQDKINKLTEKGGQGLLDDLPEIISGCAFPDCDNLADMVNKIVELDRQAVLKLVGRLLTTVPTEICRLLSNLLDIEESRLLDVKSPNPLTLNQLADIIIAFVRVNDYNDFFDSVQQLLKTFHQKNTNTQDTTGYNGG